MHDAQCALKDRVINLNVVPNAGHLITIRDVDVSQVFANASRHTAEGIVRTHSLERRSGKKRRISKTERIESMSFRV